MNALISLWERQAKEEGYDVDRKIWKRVSKRVLFVNNPGHVRIEFLHYDGGTVDLAFVGLPTYVSDKDWRELFPLGELGVSYAHMLYHGENMTPKWHLQCRLEKVTPEAVPTPKAASPTEDQKQQVRKVLRYLYTHVPTEHQKLMLRQVTGKDYLSMVETLKSFLLEAETKVLNNLDPLLALLFDE